MPMTSVHGPNNFGDDLINRLPGKGQMYQAELRAVDDFVFRIVVPGKIILGTLST